jgi:hypothetical protein
MLNAKWLFEILKLINIETVLSYGHLKNEAHIGLVQVMLVLANEVSDNT